MSAKKDVADVAKGVVKQDNTGKMFTLAQVKKMSLEALLVLFNVLAPKKVKKFSDREAAVKAVWDVLLPYTPEQKNIVVPVVATYRVAYPKTVKTDEARIAHHTAIKENIRSILRKTVYELLIKHGELTIAELHKKALAKHKDAGWELRDVQTATQNLSGDLKVERANKPA